MSRTIDPTFCSSELVIVSDIRFAARESSPSAEPDGLTKHTDFRRVFVRKRATASEVPVQCVLDEHVETQSLAAAGMGGCSVSRVRKVSDMEHPLSRWRVWSAERT